MHIYIHMIVYVLIYEYVFIKHHMLNLDNLFNNLKVIMPIKVENSNIEHISPKTKV